jgi:hypothetical protein
LITEAGPFSITARNDKKLTKRVNAKKTALEVLSFDRFIERMRSL